MTTDVVGVYNDSQTQLFANARAVKAAVKPSAKFPEHPLESGATIGDHRIFLPVEIELSVILDPEDYQSTYQQIKAAFTGTSSLTVCTRVDTYKDMYILALPREETADLFDTVAISLRLKEIPLVEAQYQQLPAAKVKTKRHASTVKTGQKQPAPATPPQSSAAHDLFKGLGWGG